MKKRIAVLFGGYSGEAEVSKKSAQMVLNNIDKDRFQAIPIEISKTNWTADYDGEFIEIDKNDFSILVQGEKLNFDGVFNIIHGTPGEDGLIQGYLDMLAIPHTTGGCYNMSLTFNKAVNNDLLRSYGMPCAMSVLLRPTDHYSVSAITERLGLPCFVKPNEGGSSIGISRVDKAEALTAAIERAFLESKEVIIEEFISGREVTCGVIPKNGKLMALPLTEIIADGDFFDFEAKYEGKSQEITPAKIDLDTTLTVQNMAVKIYELLRCNGMIRIDFLLPKSGPHVIEVNTVPGFSEASIIPQQAAAAGISKKNLISSLLEDILD